MWFTLPVYICEYIQIEVFHRFILSTLANAPVSNTAVNLDGNHEHLHKLVYSSPFVPHLKQMDCG